MHSQLQGQARPTPPTPSPSIQGYQQQPLGRPTGLSRANSLSERRLTSHHTRFPPTGIESGSNGSKGRVLAGSVHGSGLSTLTRSSTVSYANRESSALGRRTVKPGPYTPPPAVSSYSSSSPSLATSVKTKPKVATEEERWERIQYLRARAEEARLELLALEQEEQDLISPLMPSNPNDDTATSERNPPLTLKTQKGLAGSGATWYPNSPLSSPSPPISPLSPVSSTDANPYPDEGSGSLTQSRNATGSWFQKLKYPTSPLLPVNDDVEDILNSHLNHYQEDLMDVTLSEMMDRHLVLLSDSDDDCIGEDDDKKAKTQTCPPTFENINGGDDLTALSMADFNSIQDGSIEANESCDSQVDMTFADRTQMFMTRLGQEFDQEFDSPGVPSLLSETIPMNDLADMTFMPFVDEHDDDEDDEDDDEDDEMPAATVVKKMLPLLPLERSNTDAEEAEHEHEHEKERQNIPRTILSPLDIQQTSILGDFLKSLPPLPQSPELKAPQNSHLKSLGPTRTYALPAPIVTSRERCRQLYEEKTKKCEPQLQQQQQQQQQKEQQQASPILSLSPSPTCSTSSTSRYSEFSTPLTSNPPLTAESGLSSASTYCSPREDFVMPLETGTGQGSVQRVDVVAPLKTKTGQGSLQCEDVLAPMETGRGQDRLQRDDFVIPSAIKTDHDLSPKIATTTTRDIYSRSRTERSVTSSIRSTTRPLDMIIVRPTRAIESSNESRPTSPWSALTSANSCTSGTSSTSSSSWTWSWPSSSTKRATPSGVNDRSSTMHPRLPTLACGQSMIDIRSRSMSSIMKYQNGWLGFQVLDIHMVASGKKHIVVVTRSNQVYSCWEATDEQAYSRDDMSDRAMMMENHVERTLGRGTRADNGSGFVQDTTCQPGLVEFLDSNGHPMTLAPISKVVCSDHATFVLTENGDLWGWGSFEDSKAWNIGLLKNKAPLRPIQICSQKIASVVCGRNHVLILNMDGDVISWGMNDHSQLGRRVEDSAQGDSIYDLSPYFIEHLPAKMIGIGAGKNFSFAWDEEKLFGWGDNRFGQLGANLFSKGSRGKDGGSGGSTAVTMPKEISLHWKGKSIKQVQGGERHTVILTFSGLVIAMGNDDYGQLGIPSPTLPLSSPSTTLSSPSFSATSSASLLASDVSLPSSSGASSWSSVNMEMNQLLSKTAEERSKSKTRLYPALVRIGPGVREISCGDYHTATCSDNGQMYTWGRGYQGIVMVHSTDDGLTDGHSEAVDSVEPQPQWPHRMTVAVSTMPQGASIALHSTTDDDHIAALVGVDRPDEFVSLRHVLHHGGNRYPDLYRRLDVSPVDLLLTELITGESSTHRIKVKTTTTLKPRDPDIVSKGSGSSSAQSKLKRQGFRAWTTEDTSIGPESWTKEVVDAPDITDKDTIVQLSKINYNSYTEVASPGWYDLEGNWGVNSTFGWEEDGVRGHVFSSADNSTLIIAIKGTSAAILGGGGGTATRDKINDNLLFSCCCAKVDRTWRGVCDCNRGGYRCDQTCIENSVNSEDVYYNTAMKILWTVQDMYPGAKIWLTGHSLGGGLSALLGLTFGVPTVTFETPGDRLASQRLHLPAPPAIRWEDFPLFHVGHTADPIFQGVCNGPRSACYYSGFALESKCHTGRTCVYDPVGEDNWRVDIRTHRLADTIEGVLKVKSVPSCKQEVDCIDCPMWEFVE
ncbi:putative lipase atg15 [Podila epigama]|nr:putative lipase atg15 [Podila epigama]